MLTAPNNASSPLSPDDARRRFLRQGAGLALGLLAIPAQACEFATGTLTIHHPWTRAVGKDADHAVVITRFTEVLGSDTLVGVETPVAAGAVLVTPEGTGPVQLEIPQGQSIELSEAGTHIRLIGLKQPLLLGRSFPMTMEFARSGRIQTQLNVDYGGISLPRRRPAA